MIFVMTIYNVGPPTVIRGLSLDVSLANGKHFTARPEVPPEKITVPGQNGSSIFTRDDALYSKISSPISTGGQVAGTLFFSIEGLTDQDLRDKGTKLRITFYDVNMRPYHSDASGGPTTGARFLVPGTTPMLTHP
jgi:hypothetical protein